MGRNAHGPSNSGIGEEGLVGLGEVMYGPSDVEFFGKQHHPCREIMDGDSFGAKGNFGTRWPGANTGHSVDLLGEDQLIEIQRAVGVGVLETGSEGEGAADVEIVGVLQGHLRVLEGFAADLVGEDMQADASR